jgi:hypothetical protein
MSVIAHSSRPYSPAMFPLSEEAWQQGMNPDVPETKILGNPYTYTDYRSASTHRR